jgi:hypothetical protein
VEASFTVGLGQRGGEFADGVEQGADAGVVAFDLRPDVVAAREPLFIKSAYARSFRRDRTDGAVR